MMSNHDAAVRFRPRRSIYYAEIARFWQKEHQTKLLIEKVRQTKFDRQSLV